METPNWKEQFILTLEKYKYNCKVIKQINSDKALFQSNFNTRLTISTILASVVLTFFGFMNKTSFMQLIHGKVKPISTACAVVDLYTPTAYDTLVIEVIFNIAVLCVLVLSLIHLIFRPLERAFEHTRSITLLSGFIKDLDDYMLFNDYTEAEVKLLLPTINSRYKMILDMMPKSSDEDFVKAKTNITKKENEGAKKE